MIAELRHWQQWKNANIDLHSRRILLDGLKDWLHSYNRLRDSFDDDEVREEWDTYFREDWEEVVETIAEIERSFLH